MYEDKIKEYIKALRCGHGYEWMGLHGNDLYKDDLIRIVKELDYAAWFISTQYEADEYTGYDIYQIAADNLAAWYFEEEFNE